MSQDQRRFSLVLAVVVLVLSGVGVGRPAADVRQAGTPAEADGAEAARQEAKRVFDSLYATELARARASRDPREPVDLAQRLLANSRIDGVGPHLAELMLDQAHELSMRHPTGFDVAIRSMQELAQRVPDREVDALNRATAVARRAMSSADAQCRPLQARRAVELMLELAGAHEQRGELNEASRVLGQAAGTAGAAGRRAVEDVRLAQRRLDSAIRTEREVDTLKAQVESNPNDPALRERLAVLLAVDLGRGSEAAEHIRRLGDRPVRRMLEWSVLPVGRLNADQSWQLSQWYLQLASERSGDSALRLKQRGIAALERFLSVAPAEAAERANAGLLLRRTLAEVRRAGAGASTGSPGTAGRRVNLIEFIDRESAGNIWAVERGGVSVTVPEATHSEHGPRFGIEPGFFYDVSAKFLIRATPRGRRTIRICFPVDETILTFSLRPNSPSAGEGSPNFTRGVPRRVSGFSMDYGPISTPREMNVRIQVGQVGSEVDIRITVDDKPEISWQGLVSDLTPPHPNDIGHPAEIRIRFPSPFDGSILEITGGGELQGRS